MQRRRVALADLSGGVRPSTLSHRIGNERRRLDSLGVRLGPSLRRQLDKQSERLSGHVRRLRLETLVRDRETKQAAFAGLVQRLSAAAGRQITGWRTRLEALDRVRLTLGYEATLERGYAVVRGDGAVVTNSKAAGKAQALEIQFADGRIKVGQGAGPPPAPKSTTNPPGQCSLC